MSVLNTLAQKYSVIAAPTKKETYYNGDKGEYTGEVKMLHGGKFYGIKMLEGTKKGQVVWTQQGPDDKVNPGHNKPDVFKGKVPQADW